MSNLPLLFSKLCIGAIYQKQNDLIKGCFPFKTETSASPRYFLLGLSFDWLQRSPVFHNWPCLAM